MIVKYDSAYVNIIVLDSEYLNVFQLELVGYWNIITPHRI